MLLVVSLLVFAGCQEMMGRLAPVADTATVDGLGGRQAISAEVERLSVPKGSPVEGTRHEIIAFRVRMKAPPPPEPRPLRLVVRFRYDKACVSESAAEEVRSWARRLAPGTSVSVEGHTDAHGTLAYNRWLSGQRVVTVVELLHGRKVRQHVYGESRPVAPNEVDGHDNPRGRIRNRRVEVRLVNVRDAQVGQANATGSWVVEPAPCWEEPSKLDGD